MLRMMVSCAMFLIGFAQMAGASETSLGAALESDDPCLANSSDHCSADFRQLRGELKAAVTGELKADEKAEGTNNGVVTAASTSFTVKVVSHVCPNRHCILEHKAIRLFIPRSGYSYSQHNLGCRGGRNTLTFRYDPRIHSVGFGVQENAWYWRGPRANAHLQNPDNAGMQVILAPGCRMRTSASVHDHGDPPDARRLLNVQAHNAGGVCVVDLYRKRNPSLCVSGSGRKKCCGPCAYQWQLGDAWLEANLSQYLPPCCRKERDGGSHTC